MTQLISQNIFSHPSYRKNRSGVSETLGIQKNSSLNGPVEFRITTLLTMMMIIVVMVVEMGMLKMLMMKYKNRGNGKLLGKVLIKSY